MIALHCEIRTFSKVILAQQDIVTFRATVGRFRDRFWYRSRLWYRFRNRNRGGLWRCMVSVSITPTTSEEKEAE
jgi:hypothetical protein